MMEDRSTNIPSSQSVVNNDFFLVSFATTDGLIAEYVKDCTANIREGSAFSILLLRTTCLLTDKSIYTFLYIPV